MTRTRVFRHAREDVFVLDAALIHAAAVATALPIAAAGGAIERALVALVLGVGMCWGSNTVSHIHVHSPLFHSETANRAFSLFLSVLLAVPQKWWKRRHLLHHGHAPVTLGRDGLTEIVAVFAALGALAAFAPQLFATVYLPSILVGLALCAIQGQQEHVRSDAGVDHHGRLYNRLWFNDGFHAAHHRAPTAHWTSLPRHAVPADAISALPPILRWIESLDATWSRLSADALDVLEAATIDNRLVRALLLHTHGRAIERLLPPAERARIRHVTIVGGGLFPRTALLAHRLLPDAQITVVDTVPAHLEEARRVLADHGITTRLHFMAAAYTPTLTASSDLVVFPLAFRGDRSHLYQRPVASLVLVHDWLWRPRGSQTTRVSLLLLKRLNLVRTSHDADEHQF